MEIKIPEGLETIGITKVKPYHRNARINEKTVEFLIKAIKKVGFNQPILVDKNFVIVKGHARYKAAVRLGMTEIPYIRTMNSEQLNQFDRIVDNKIAELSKWDDHLLMNELGVLELEMLNDIPNIKLPDIVTEKNAAPEAADLSEGKEIPTFIREGGTPAEEDFDENGNFIEDSKFQQHIEDRQKNIVNNFVHLQCPHCKQKFDVLKRDIK